jgi:hypothetical protein
MEKSFLFLIPLKYIKHSERLVPGPGGHFGQIDPYHISIHTHITIHKIKTKCMYFASVTTMQKLYVCPFGENMFSVTGII